MDAGRSCALEDVLQTGKNEALENLNEVISFETAVNKGEEVLDKM